MAINLIKQDTINLITKKDTINLIKKKYNQFNKNCEKDK